MLTTRPRGTNDILPDEVHRWQYLERTIAELCRHYGYQEIRTPVFEHTELFYRGVGETTDIVEKEMYTFLDRGGRSLTLRPEGTAPVVRALLEHGLHSGMLPLKLYYVGPMFRFSRPQAGRFRQFHQFGVEVIGSKDPAVDAEVIAMAMDLYHRLGLMDLDLMVNSVGCPACRPVHREVLQAHLGPVVAELCPTCQGRYGKNPLRIMDCKGTRCQELVRHAPTITHSLCPDCRQHFQGVLRYLEIAGIKYRVEERLVRGLDYYTNTAFEIMAGGIGAQSAIGGGGRYDGLVEACGGPSLPGVGFGLGLERILLAMAEQGIGPSPTPVVEVYVAAAGSEARQHVFGLLQHLRLAGLSAASDNMERSLKAQFKQADRYGARFNVIIGEEELESGTVIIRDMREGNQEQVSLRDAVGYLTDRVARR